MKQFNGKEKIRNRQELKDSSFFFKLKRFLNQLKRDKVIEKTEIQLNNQKGHIKNRPNDQEELYKKKDIDTKLLVNKNMFPKKKKKKVKGLNN